MAKNPPAVKVIHSSKIKASNLKKANDRLALSRENHRKQYIMYNVPVIESELDEMFAPYDPATMAEGFHVFIKSAIFGPYDTEQDAQDHGGEIAYEMTT